MFLGTLNKAQHRAGPSVLFWQVPFSCFFEIESYIEPRMSPQAGLKIAAIVLPEPPECWDYRCEAAYSLRGARALGMLGEYATD